MVVVILGGRGEFDDDEDDEVEVFFSGDLREEPGGPEGSIPLYRLVASA